MTVAAPPGPAVTTPPGVIDPEDIDQVPPVVPSDNVVIAPEQTVVAPDMAVGGVLIDTANVVAVAVTEVVPHTLVAVSV